MYQSIYVQGNIFLPESSEYLCPKCQTGLLEYRDHCERIVRYEDGSSEWIRIPRHKCSNDACGCLHRMLPHELLPFKHYAEETISGVLDGVVQSDDEESENFPSERTMNRWHHWLMANRTNIDGIIKSVGFRELGYSFDFLKSGISLLDSLRESMPDSWLRIIVRFIYNSGDKLAPVC